MSAFKTRVCRISKFGQRTFSKSRQVRLQPSLAPHCKPLPLHYQRLLSYTGFPFFMKMARILTGVSAYRSPYSV
jgi:hypothetical protein